MKRVFSELMNLVFRSRRAKEEEGQGLVELTVAVSLLAVVIIVSFEFALLFASYIALLSSARASARYASTQPTILEHLDRDYEEYCTPESQGEDYCRQYEMYLQYVESEVLAAGLDQDEVTIEKVETEMNALGQPLIDGGNPVTVTLRYNLSTFTSGIRLPFFGRFGLPDTYRITAVAAFPIGGE